jgi:hypothetical protein
LAAPSKVSLNVVVQPAGGVGADDVESDRNAAGATPDQGAADAGCTDVHVASAMAATATAPRALRGTRSRAVIGPPVAFPSRWGASHLGGYGR